MTTNLEVNPAVKVLVDARKLLEEEGWCQYAMQDDNGRRCIYGALEAVSFRSRSVPNVEALLLQATGATSAVYGMALVQWNNAPERTKEEVLAAFDRAISIALGVT